MNERRTLGRYDLPFPARIRLKDNRQSMWSEGQTRDISAQGVYLRAQEGIPVGAHVEMYFTLPEKVTQGAKVFIHAFGRVLRVEKREEAQDTIGVAAMIERYDITRVSPSETHSGKFFSRGPVLPRSDGNRNA
jgi:c-di-GMP-binding flagellar brake protein YcgR